MTWWQSHSFDAANNDFQQRKDTITRTLQGSQAEVNRGTQSYQYITSMVQDIYNATDESKGGKRDDDLKGLVSKDLEAVGLHVSVASPSPAPSPGSSPAASSSPAATSTPRN